MHQEHIRDNQILGLCARPLTSGKGVSVARRKLLMHGGLTLQNCRGKGAGRG